MRNRIEQRFADLKKDKAKAFIAFITAGFPDLKTTARLIFEMEKVGVDIVELGMPFSDPLADGPTIQMSSDWALKRNVTLRKVLDLVAQVRKRSQIPLALMSYYNPVFRFGHRRFIQEAKSKGLDGIIIPDLPPEEAAELIGYAKKDKICTIFFLAPTSTRERIRLVSKKASGFIYYVSLTGVTGIRENLASGLKKNVEIIRQYTDKPVCVGFGISTPGHVKTLSMVSDGVIVGSAIIKQIQSNIGKKDLVKKIGRFISKLMRPIK
jgi:tryptophan synthase alpha chain